MNLRIVLGNIHKGQLGDLLSNSCLAPGVNKAERTWESLKQLMKCHKSFNNSTKSGEIKQMTTKHHDSTSKG